MYNPPDAAAPGTSGPRDAGFPLLEVRDLVKKYNSSRESIVAIESVSVNLAQGEFLSVVGPSGCGKSTLLKIIAGLSTATSGSIRLNGSEIVGPGPDRGFVFQGDALLPWRTIRQNVALGLEISGRDREAARVRTDEMLELVGLAEFGDRFPVELSGGMRQRANLARGLALDPPVLLMDEPFAALDAQTREIMQTELLKIWRQNKKSVIFITHQLDEAVFLSDRIVLMSARPGRIIGEFVVPIERPRSSAVRFSDEFRELNREIWEQLRDEVTRANDQSKAATLRGSQSTRWGLRTRRR
jgi:NitT/TauT family transport system ATP-binding protein